MNGSEAVWFGWIAFGGPFVLIAALIFSMWAGVKLHGAYLRYLFAVPSNLPRMQVHFRVKCPLGRPRVFY